MLIFGAYRLYLYAAKSYIRIKILAAYVINDPIIHISQLKKRRQLKCHTVTKLVFLPKVAPIWLKFIQIHHHIQCTTEIYMADGQLPINWPSMPWNVWKCSVSPPCHTVTFFHSEHMSSKYIPRTRFISLNDYDDDVPRFSDDIVIWCIQMYSVIRINNVIKLGSGIRVIADCRLPPALLDQNWFVERVIWKVLLLHNKILINQDFMYLEGAHQGTQFSNAPPDLISLVLFMNRDVIGQVCPFFEESGNIIGTVDCQNLLVAMNVQRDCLK